MLELALPILGFAVKYLPDLVGLLAGPSAGAVAGEVLNAAKSVFGTTDPAEIESKVALDNNLLERFKAALSTNLESYRLELADIQNARSQTVLLAQAGSAIAWGAPIMSVLVTSGFIAILVLWLFHPPTNDPAVLSVLNMLVGSLSAAFGAVVQYWLGSSASSRGKDNTIAAMTFAPTPTVKKK